MTIPSIDKNRHTVVNLEKCRDWLSFSYSGDGWHYFCASLKNYLEDPEIHYTNNVLYKYYKLFQPKSLRDAFSGSIDPSLFKDGNFWGPLPWVTLGYNGEPSINYQHFGPCTEDFVESEFLKLINIYQRLSKEGYCPSKYPDGYIRGYFLKYSDDYRFIVTAGQHRMAALGLLSYKECEVLLQPYYPTIVDIEEVDRWVNVLNGKYSPEQALDIFNVYFKSNGKRRAAALGLYYNIYNDDSREIGGNNMYQDTWVKGRLVKKGQRDCSNRYSHIKSYLEASINGPFSVLDVGANLGYFSFRIAEDFDSEVTMIEASKQINTIHLENNNEKVSLINKMFSNDDLNQLRNERKFNVVLALSILHHFEDYKKTIDTLFLLGDIIFIEPPAPEESRGGYNGQRAKGIIDYLNSKEHEILTYTPNLRNLGKRPLMVFKNKEQ